MLKRKKREKPFNNDLKRHFQCVGLELIHTTSSLEIEISNALCKSWTPGSNHTMHTVPAPFFCWILESYLDRDWIATFISAEPLPHQSSHTYDWSIIISFTANIATLCANYRVSPELAGNWEFHSRRTSHAIDNCIHEEPFPSNLCTMHSDFLLAICSRRQKIVSHQLLCNMGYR
jgi:hypothetical protein